MSASSAFGFLLITAPAGMAPTLIAFSIGHKNRYVLAGINVAVLLAGLFLPLLVIAILWLFVFGYAIRGDSVKQTESGEANDQ